MSKFGKHISIVGLGYIGLPTAALLANKGFHVQGFDINPEVVCMVNRGEVHIIEKDLDQQVYLAVKNGYLKAYSEVQPANIFLIAVPTPFTEGHKPDLASVEAAARSIAPVLQPGNLIILESTCPVGTTLKVAKWLAQQRPELSIPFNNENQNPEKGEQIYLSYCPERVLPGHILRELIENDRIIGGINSLSTEKAINFYQNFVKGDMLATDSRTAEMAKLTENAFRDVNIAFANELSLICDELNINVWELIRLANRHPRVNILQPGPGVGGHCIAVDPWFIVDSAPKQARLIRQARLINDEKPEFVVAKALAATAQVSKATIACLGLSFKANIDDLRESPALKIVRDLAIKSTAKLLVVEPHINTIPKQLMDLKHRIQLVDTETALKDANIILLLVDHCQFNLVGDKVKQKIVIDTRGIWQ